MKTQTASSTIVKPNMVSRKSALETIIHKVRGGEINEYQATILIQELFGLTKQDMLATVKLDNDFVEVLSGL